MKIEALLFDVFGTVVDWRRGVAAAVAAAYAGKGREVDAPAFADAWRREYDPALAPIRDRRRPYVALDLLHAENLERVLAARGEADLFDAAERADLARAWERLPPWPDSVAGLAALRRTVPAATCSNGSIRLMLRLARHAGLTWDAILGAEIAQSYKPDPAVYLTSAAALGLAPERVAMVAAHAGDLEAARALGFRTIFIERPEEWGPGVAPDRGDGAWDVEAAGLEDLARRLVP